MHRRLRRLARRLVALAPVIAALGGQALAAGSLRASYLPHAGTTPAPLSHALAAGSAAAGSAAAGSAAAGIAALRRAAHDAHRADLEARVDALVQTLPGALGIPTPAPVSQIDNIRPPGSRTLSAVEEMDISPLDSAR